MEIALFQAAETLRMERAVFYPYPDLKRIWARVWLSAVQDEKPNLELTLYNPDGTENCSVFLLAHAEQRVETTLHLRQPVAGTTYHAVAELTLGMGDQTELLERREFDVRLEFRNPDAGDPGFGFGVDWDEIKRKAQRL